MYLLVKCMYLLVLTCCKLKLKALIFLNEQMRYASVNNVLLKNNFSPAKKISMRKVTVLHLANIFNVWLKRIVQFSPLFIHPFVISQYS